MLKFDVAALIARFGGDEALHYALAEAGFDPPQPNGIGNWRRRGFMTTDRVAQCCAIAERQGAPLNLNDYLKPDFMA
jgi:hypothetical protein